MSKTIRTMGGFLLTLALLLSMSVTVLAYTPLDPERTGSITVSPTSGKSIGTELSIYRVADVVVDNADQQYILTEDFSGSGADLTNLDNTEELAKTLSAYAANQGLSGTTKAVGTDGSVTFDSLPLGLYLLIQTVAQPGESIVNPFLVSVPMLDGNAEWVYDVDAGPKAETYELIDVTVKKVWNDGNNTSSRPSSVTVNLYDGSTLIDTVTLVSANSWSHTWTGLKKSDGYSVSEEPVNGYTTAYSQSGYMFTITNTGGSTTPGGSSTPPGLAQTGQLNWPIPLLAVCGVALFAIGWGLVFLKRKNDA